MDTKIRTATSLVRGVVCVCWRKIEIIIRNIIMIGGNTSAPYSMVYRSGKMSDILVGLFRKRFNIKYWNAISSVFNMCAKS